MPLWSNNDSFNSKPKFVYERQVDPTYTLPTALAAASGNTVLYFNGTDVANANVQIGWIVDSANVSLSTVAGWTVSNNKVAGVSANTITLANATFGIVNAGQPVLFSKPISFKANTQAATYNQDTVLVTNTRMANANTAKSNTAVRPVHTGWVHVQKKVNNDGTVRYLSETLTVSANASASNTSSGNTSFGQVYSGL